MIRTILITTLCLLTLTVAGQRRKKPSAAPQQIAAEKVVRTPLDTVATAEDGTYVIIYSNNTWEFHRPEMQELETLNIYRHNWDTASIFAYRNIELSNLPSVIDLKLVENLGQFCYPIIGSISSRYGPRGRRGRAHNGVDIPLKIGEPVLSTFDGKVRYAKFNSGGFGYLVIIRHANGLETYSAHLSRLNVKVGDYVKAGQIVGFGGNTGRSRGPHLHFEMRYLDQTFDPERLIDFQSGSLRYMTFALEKSYFNIHSRASEMLEDGDEDELPGVNEILAAADDSVAVRVSNPDEMKQKPAPSNTIYHKVVSGDMLGKLALKYGVSVDQICRLNNITRTTTLQLGKKLRIK